VLGRRREDWRPARWGNKLYSYIYEQKLQKVARQFIVKYQTHTTFIIIKTRILLYTKISYNIVII